MIDAGVEELKERAYREGLRQARMEGHAQGRMEGSATLVCRLAGLKFGPETAEQLSQLLEGIADPGRIARVGERIIECETGAELLSRVVRRVPDRDPKREHALLVWEVLKAWVSAGAESWGLGDEVMEEMKRLDEQITRICERNEWETSAQLMARTREG